MPVSHLAWTSTYTSLSLLQCFILLRRLPTSSLGVAQGGLWQGSGGDRPPRLYAGYEYSPRTRQHTDGLHYQGNLKPLDAHFVAIWTRWYALTHSPTICHSLRRVRSRLPRSRISRIYVVTVFLSRLPTQFTVSYNTNAPSCPEDTVVVMACMAGPGRSGPIDLRVVSSSVTFLEEYAASLVKGGYRVADWRPIIEKMD